MKSKSILLSLSTLLLLSCGTTKNNQSPPSEIFFDAENELFNKQAETVVKSHEKPCNDSSTVAISLIDSLILIGPWDVIQPPPSILPWDIIIPSPYPYQWSWILSPSIYFISNSRPEDDNDRVYNHLIMAENCYQIQKTDRELALQLDISDSQIINCFIEAVDKEKSSVNTSPIWLNSPIMLNNGIHNYSIPYYTTLGQDYRLTLKTKSEIKHIMIRV